MASQALVDDSGTTRLNGVLVTAVSDDSAASAVPALSMLFVYTIIDPANAKISLLGKTTDGTLIDGAITMT